MTSISTVVLLSSLTAGLASLALACTSTTSASKTPAAVPPVDELVERSRDGNAALMRGDIERYVSLVSIADDFTLFSPFGGEPTRGAPDSEGMQRLGRFFKNGTLEQEVVHTYSTEDMVVLAVIERAHVEVSNLPMQDWALRVTLVYRREGERWWLVHRHADPLAHGISHEQSAALGRGAP